MGSFINSRSQLWLKIYQHFGIRLPYIAQSRGHSTPLDFIFDALQNPGCDVAVWANRRGAKTLSASILAALEYMLADGPIKSRILSGSEQQARSLYEYWLNWCGGPLAGKLVGSATKQATKLVNGDLEILSASQRSVRGPAIQRIYWDEVDEIDSSVMAASVGSLNSLKNMPARSVATSTWHNAHGPMGRLVADAENSGIRLHRWNIWETIQRCPTERHDHGRGCAACKLANVCLGHARGKNRRATVGTAASACGLLAIDDVVRQYSMWSQRQWESEAECKRPQLDGLVYSEFDRADHVDNSLCYCESLPLFRAIDWGLNEFVCLWVQQGKNGCVYIVDELVLNQATVHVAADRILDRDVARRVESTFCDPAGRNRNDQSGYSDVDIFASRKIPCRYTLDPWAREILNGVNLIRSFLRPAIGMPRLKISGRCTQLIKAFESYKLRQENGQYIDEPIKPQNCDHAMDALRYWFVNRVSPIRASTQRMPTI